MRIGRRGFLAALASVPFLQLPLATVARTAPPSPVAGWTFVWHEWEQMATRHAYCGFWVALSEERIIVHPELVPEYQLAAGTTLDEVKRKAYDVVVAEARHDRALDPYERWMIT